jgi:hypothetical protein
MKKMLNEGTGNQTHNFISSSGSGSDFLISYGSGSSSGFTSQKVTVHHTVPVQVPQRCLAGVLALRPCSQTAPRTLGTAHFQDCCC